MILNGIRIFTDWFGDATDGVNALLAGIEKDGTDQDPVPPLVGIHDATRHPGFARGDIPETLAAPWLCVLQWEESLFEDAKTAELLQGEDIPLAVVVGLRDEKSDRAATNAYHYLRAAMRSINRLMDPGAKASAARVRNNIALEMVNRMFAPRIIAPWQHTTLTAALFVSVQCAELNP